MSWRPTGASMRFRDIPNVSLRPREPDFPYSSRYLLTFCVVNWASTLWRIPRLVECTSLEILELRLSTITDSELDDRTKRLASRSDQAFDANVEIVRSSPPSTRVVALRVQHFGANMDSFIPVLEALPWGVLDAALMALPRLEGFAVYAHRIGLAGKDLDYTEMLQMKLPRVRAARKLQVHLR